MKKFTAAAFISLFTLSTIAEVTPEWVRYPAISPDGMNVAFTYKGDIYRVSIDGGEAKRLTVDQAHEYRPVWSKDGTKIAFASARHGNFDVFVMAAEGGPSTRLTYHSGDEEPYTFSQDDQSVLFKGLRMDLASHRQYPTSRQAELYSVPTSGGRVDQVLTVPAEDVQISADNETYIYHDNKGFEDPWRKHHKSAIARDIWQYDSRSGQHTKLTSFDGEDRNPVYADDGQHIYYLSEQNGSFNVHKMSLDAPSESTQITQFNTHPVRFLSQANNTLVFTHHGDLYRVNNEGDAEKIAISVRAQDIGDNQKMMAVDGDISSIAISPDGKQVAFISRGDVFVTSPEGKFTKQITNTPERENFVSFSTQGDSLIYAAQRQGQWGIYQTSKVRKAEPFFYAATLFKEVPLVTGEVDYYQPKMSPDGKKLAYIADRRELRVRDLKTQKDTTLVGRKDTIHMRDGDQNFNWSPDSKWIVFEYGRLLNNSDITLLDASGKKPMKPLIADGFYDVNPQWLSNGEQITWMSNRDGLRSYATSGRTQYDVYSVFLTQKAWDKFNLNEDEYKLTQAIEEANKPKTDKDDKKKKNNKKKDKKESKKSTSPVKIEWENLDNRIAKLTIHSSALADAVLSKDAETLYYLSQFEDKYDLWETNLRTKETKKKIPLKTDRGSLLWDPKMETLYLVSSGKIRKLDLEKGKAEAVAVSERIAVDTSARRLAEFDQVWHRTAEVFYEPTYHGLDWDMMRAEYRNKVSHVGNDYELAELLAEMLGELNVSHSGARYTPSSPDADATAVLGVFHDYQHQGAGIKITEVIKGGPLDKAAIKVNAGMIIEKIDGVAIDNSMDWHQLLNHKANKFVLLDISDGENKKRQQITIKPISIRDQSRLLYQRYIDINAQEVLDKSNGRLGYVHIPGMSDGPYRRVLNDMLGKYYDKEGMIIDTRFNGGGDLVADLVMFFTGEPFLTYATHDKVVGGEPTSRYTKPVLSLFNESMYSDGHCYASGFVDLKVGKSVGMPVPGTCSFSGWERLPSGIRWGIVPVSAKNKAGEWLENNQDYPDIIIKNQPGVIDFGRDEQLERGIKELLNQLAM